MKINRTAFRWTTRLILLAAALFFILSGPLPVWMKRLIPSLSPLSLLAESAAQRAWFAGLFYALPALAVLGLACLKGRFFCRWLCPLGTVYSLPGRLPLPKKKIMPVRLNAFFFWLIVSSSLFGIPLLLFLDPLSTFSRAGVWYEAAAWIPGVLIPLMLLISFFQPQMWCTHLCPLGYLFDAVNPRTARRVFRRDRRQFLAGCGIGVPAALLLPAAGRALEKPSVLPPGALKTFAEMCTRCYACVRGCPAGIIRVKRDGRLFGLAMPELSFDEGACLPECSRCSQICPTGAIRPLSPEEKQHTQIGIAKVFKKRCLAWEDKEFCMVCDEVCPYSAIETRWQGDVACPEVNPATCRGCGFCEKECPAVRAGKAILVQPLNPQSRIPDGV